MIVQDILEIKDALEDIKTVQCTLQLITVWSLKVSTLTLLNKDPTVNTIKEATRLTPLASLVVAGL